MNTKKALVTALTAAVAVSSVAAVSVSAVGIGETQSDVRSSATAEAGKVTHFSVTINDVTIDADVPADAIEAGKELTFGAALITNVDIEAAVANLPDAVTAELLDIYFLDGDKNVSFNGDGVQVTVTTTTTAYETIYIYEDENGLSKLAETTDNKLSFIAPHFSYYVLTKNVEKSEEPSTPEPSQNVQPSNGNTDNNNNNNNNNGSNTNNNGANNNGGVNTGDSTTTAAVFAIVGAAALGTALVASKSKKHAK